MNRERILFVVVVALVALWYFVLREDVKFETKATAPSLKQDVLAVRAIDQTRTLMSLPEPYGAFTQVSNETEHPRPQLDTIVARDMQNIWPPTSVNVRRALFGRLRRNTVAPVEGEATITLPPIDTDEAAGVEDDAKQLVKREDSWTGLGGGQQSGRVRRIRLKSGTWVSDPGDLPMPGKIDDNSFLALLIRAEADQLGAAEVIASLELELKAGGRVTLKFPDEANNIRMAVTGEDRAWWEGFRTYKRQRTRTVGDRISAAEQLMERGRVASSLDPRIGWASAILETARENVPPTTQNEATKLLMPQLEVAQLLFQYERMLELAFTHLDKWPSDARVIEKVGSLLASRNFGLLDQAERWFARAPQLASAQIRRIEVLIALDRFDEARALLDQGRAGAGARVNLLAARVALALGDFQTAVTKASAYTVGENGGEANKILGGVAYAQGDAAKAEEYFLAAIERDSTDSYAYSDLGLALAVQGKVADALACFERAEGLDFENTVTPGIGRVFLKFAAADAHKADAAAKRRAAEARKNRAELLAQAEEAEKKSAEEITAALAMLTAEDGLEENNPLDLMVRYFVGYALERQGDQRAAFEKYRSVIDNDHRMRIAIARLGVVLARFVEANPDDARAAEFAKASDAHLTKAQALNPQDPIPAYILGRFHMLRDTQRSKANRMLGIAAGLAAPTGDPDLPQWAAAGMGALAYRNDDIEVSKVKSMFNNVERDVRRRVSQTNPDDLQKAVEANPVYRYCVEALRRINENAKKRVITFNFRSTIPKRWKVNKSEGVSIGVRGGALEFRGTIGDGDALEKNSISFKDNNVRSDTYHRMEVTGTMPEVTNARLGVGIVRKRRARGKRNVSGIQIWRANDSKRPEILIDGARTVPRLKNDSRSGTITILNGVDWPGGKFSLTIRVVDREKGTLTADLKVGDGPSINLVGAVAKESDFTFEEGFGEPAETTRLMARGGSGGAFEVYIWVEGRDGAEYREVRIDSVRLVKSVR
ncbi:MAG: hypothetical protein AAGD14_12320 [Planctomycetota bacterium]